MNDRVIDDLRTAAARFHRDLKILASEVAELRDLFHPETGTAPARGGASAEAKAQGVVKLITIVETSRAALRDVDALLGRYRRVR